MFYLGRGEVLLEPLDEPQPVPDVRLQATVSNGTTKQRGNSSINQSDPIKQFNLI